MACVVSPHSFKLHLIKNKIDLIKQYFWKFLLFVKSYD